MESKLQETFVTHTEMRADGGWPLTFSVLPVASHRLPTFCEPVPNGPRRKRLWCERAAPLIHTWVFTAHLSKLLIRRHFCTRWVLSETGATQAPMVCSPNTDFLHEADSQIASPLELSLDVLLVRGDIIPWFRDYRLFYWEVFGHQGGVGVE